MKRIYRIGDEPMKERKGKGLFVFCCLAPAAILFILFMIVPTIEIFRISLYKWGGYTDNKTFVGLSNFKSLLQNQKFYQAFQNQTVLKKVTLPDSLVKIGNSAFKGCTNLKQIISE